MSTCPSRELAVWVYISHPSKFVEEHLQHTCYKQPLIPPYVSYRKAFGKTSTSTAKFLLSRSCYRTPGNNVPSPNPRILYVSSLPSPQQSDTGNTFSLFNFWFITLSYRDNFSLKLTRFLSPLLSIHTWVGYFTVGWAIPFQGFTYFKPTQLLQIRRFYVTGKGLYLNIAQVQQLLSSQHSTIHHWYE